MPDCRRTQRGQDGVAVDGAQAGAQSRRPRAAHPARQRRTGVRCTQCAGGLRSAEPGVEPGLPALDLHRARRPRRRRIRRPDARAQRRAPGLAVARREERLRLPAADRRCVHRFGRPGPAGPECLGDRGHPLQQQPHAAEDDRDDPRGGADGGRARRAAHPRHRRRHPAPALPAAAVVVDRQPGRPGHRRAGVVAFRRRQHLRRRLHPDHGPGVGARRLHGQLLPLVRNT